MKNIYILPTDKPSRLSFDFDEEKYLLTDDLVLFDNQNILENRNIYITSDEEIKKGDWCINPKNNNVMKVGHYGHYGYSSKKIILTTDPFLINDYVQEVPEDFLKWFVRNSECNYVDIKIDGVYKMVYNPNYKKFTPDGDGIYITDNDGELQFGEELIKDNLFDYKTILPSNEITPEQLFNDDKREGVRKLILEYKNSNTSPEEELLNNIKYVLSVGNDSQAIRLIEQYGHWKQEGLFSEKDVNEIIAETWNSCEDNEGETYTQVRERIINTHKNK